MRLRKGLRNTIAVDVTVAELVKVFEIWRMVAVKSVKKMSKESRSSQYRHVLPRR